MKWRLIAAILLLGFLGLMSGCGSTTAPRLWTVVPHSNSMDVSTTEYYAVQVHWSGVSISGGTGYYICEDGQNGWNPGTACNSTNYFKAPTSSPYTLGNLSCGNTYSFAVSAHDSAGPPTNVSTSLQGSYATPACTTGVYISGNLIKNSTGTIGLHGVNRQGFEYQCIHGQGITDPGSPPLTSAQEFEPMQTWDINSAWIGLNEDCWLGVNGSGISNWSADSGTNYINAVKAWVAGAESYGITPVIALMWYGPGTSPATGTDALTDNDHAPLFWQQVADTFKNDPNVIFRLYEENYLWHGLEANWQCWAKGDVQYSTSSDNAFGTAPTPSGETDGCSALDIGYSTVGMQSLVNIIRGTGATNIIQLPGLNYANMASCDPSQSPVACGMLDSTDGSEVTDPIAGTDPNGSQLMAVFDMYPDSGQYCDVLSCYEAQYPPLAAVMPVMIGETGYGGPQDIALLNYMDSIGQPNYSAWSWNPSNATPPDQLVLDFDGTPSGATSNYFGTSYKDLLTASGVPVNSAAPVISGTAQDTFILSATTGTWSPSGLLSYQWQDCTGSGTGCTAISGANSATYTVQDGDVGDYINVIVTVSNTFSTGVSSTSNSTAQIANPPSPTNGLSIVSTGTTAGSSPGCLIQGGTSVTIPLGSGSKPIVAGDDLFFVTVGQSYGSGSTAATVTAISDNINGAWTRVANVASSTLDGNAYVAYSVWELTDSAAASSGLTMTLTTSGTTGAQGTAYDVHDTVHTSPTIEAQSFQSSIQSQNGTWTGPTLSSVTSGDLVLGLFGAYNSNPDSLAATSPWLTRGTYWNAVNFCGDTGLVWSQPSSTASSTPVMSDTTNTNLYIGGAIDLRP